MIFGPEAKVTLYVTENMKDILTRIALYHAEDSSKN